MGDNPNEYDDNRFAEVSTEFQGNVPEMVDDLWNAGASSEDIGNEIANALENAANNVDAQAVLNAALRASTH